MSKIKLSTLSAVADAFREIRKKKMTNPQEEKVAPAKDSSEE